jgi:uncharacterized protein
MKNNTSFNPLLILLGIFGAFLAGYLFSGIGNANSFLSFDTTSLAGIFLTGLLAGGLTCLAVQGGLLASAVAQREELALKKNVTQTGNALPILSFLTTKLIAYTILGFLLGWLGSVVQLSLTAKVLLQFAAVIFMLGTALNLLNVHPIFRYFAIQPPKFLTRMVRKQSKSGELFAPALLGAMTVFIPCGATQAMMALSIASGNPFMGAAILFVFVLGTSPLFFVLGYFASRLGQTMQQQFLKIAAFAIILLAIYNLNATIALTGSTITPASLVSSAWCGLTSCNKAQALTVATQEATIEFQRTTYYPTSFTVKAGSSVKLNLVNKDGYGCVQAFTIPTLGIQKIVGMGKSDSIEFKAPDKPQQIAFMCSMGMYQGVINVI